MLRKRCRLKSRSVFRRTLAGKRLCGNDCVSVYGLRPLAERGTGNLPRFGFIVSKKVHKHAVRRNRVKRRLREIVRLDLLTPPRLEAVSRFAAVVIIAREKSLAVPYATLRQRLLSCFEARASC